MLFGVFISSCFIACVTTIDDDVEPIPDYKFCCRHTYRPMFAGKYLIEPNGDGSMDEGESNSTTKAE